MTFKDLQDRALEEVGYDFSTSSSTPRTRMKKRINDWHRRLLSRPGFARLLRPSITQTFASVNGIQRYGIPMATARIDALRELTDNWLLDMQTLTWLRQQDPGLTASGTPTCWIPIGWYPVQQQPSVADAVKAISTSAADNTQTVRMEYLTAGGVRKTASVALNGTTAVTVVASDCLEITELYLSATCAGSVGIEQTDDPGPVLVSIPTGYTSLRFFHVQLWPTPTAAITYRIDATRELADMAQDTEVPLLPPDFHHILWRGAVVDEWVMKDDTRSELMRADLENELRHLQNWLWNLVPWVPTPLDQRPRFSRLGSWFPQGS